MKNCESRSRLQEEIYLFFLVEVDYINVHKQRNERKKKTDREKGMLDAGHVNDNEVCMGLVLKTLQRTSELKLG